MPPRPRRKRDNRVRVELKLSRRKFPGYSRAKDAAGRPLDYYFKFEGGTDKKGNVDVVEERRRTVIIVEPGNVSTRRDFWVVAVQANKVNAKSSREFSYEISPSRRFVRIINRATEDKADLEYSVVVQRKGFNELIFCCPRVRNRFRRL